MLNKGFVHKSDVSKKPYVKPSIVGPDGYTTSRGTVLIVDHGQIPFYKKFLTKENIADYVNTILIGKNIIAMTPLMGIGYVEGKLLGFTILIDDITGFADLHLYIGSAYGITKVEKTVRDMYGLSNMNVYVYPGGISKYLYDKLIQITEGSQNETFYTR